MTADQLKSVYDAIVTHPKYLAGITYGKPRKGHDEGTVANHLIDLDENLKRLVGLITLDEYWKLRILIHVHDTFKKWSKRDVPIDQHNSHASMAADFLAQQLPLGEGHRGENEDLIKMVQWHDENFALWKKMKRNGDYPHDRFQGRVLSIRDIELFLMFTILDGYTPAKMALADQEKPEKLRWFVDEVNRHRPVPRAYQALTVFGL